MSTTTKKTSTKGVRYNDAQKKEVVDFVNEYNATNGRGGQSKAAEKYNVSQLTISTWLKNAAGGSTPKDASAPKAAKASKPTKAAKAPKVAKAPKAAKAPKKAAKAPKAGKGRVGTRYTDAEKKEVVDYVLAYNAANGRGGQSKASAKFKVSPLTVMSWMKALGAPAAARKGRGPGKNNRGKSVAKASAAPKGSGDMSSKLSALLSLSNQIAKSEDELAQLKAKFASIKASL